MLVLEPPAPADATAGALGLVLDLPTLARLQVLVLEPPTYANAGASASRNLQVLALEPPAPAAGASRSFQHLQLEPPAPASAGAVAWCWSSKYLQLLAGASGACRC